MQTRLSSKGQVVLPGAIRRLLGLRAGDELDARVKGDQIVLTLIRTRGMKPTIRKDPLTGLPVLSAGTDSPTLSSDQVQEILAAFP
jgi:AbrB family looped-hinge helix DNA binding protein